MTDALFGWKLENFFGQINPTKNQVKLKYGYIFEEEALIKFGKGFKDQMNQDLSSIQFLHFAGKSDIIVRKEQQ